MTEHVASRTLVKSPPELWAECSDAASLARHLDQFGDIKITRLDPETAVAWEGERARGTVRIEPAGWGTKVILTAVAVEEKKPEEAPAVVEVVEATVEVPDVPDVPEAAGEGPDVPEAGEPTEAARREVVRCHRSRRALRVRSRHPGTAPAPVPPAVPVQA